MKKVACSVVFIIMVLSVTVFSSHPAKAIQTFTVNPRAAAAGVDGIKGTADDVGPFHFVEVGDTISFGGIGAAT